MKIHTLVWFLSASVISATDSAVPRFSETLLARPELSLSEAVKSGSLPPIDPAAKAAVTRFRHAPERQKQRVSHLRIIEPRDEIDRNMPVVEPKADVDSKMIVKDPTVDSAK